MLPPSLLSITPGEPATPAFLEGRDAAWTGALLDLQRAFVGRTARERDVRLPPLARAAARPVGAATRAIDGVLHVLARLFPARVAVPIEPRVVRRVVFAQAASGEAFAPEQAVGESARHLGISPALVVRALFADRANERAVVDAPIDALSVIDAYNLALVEGLLRTSEEVVLECDAHDRVLSFARRAGLLCTYNRGKLRVSGPLAVLRHTAKYGHRFASFFPAFIAAGSAMRVRCRVGRTPWLVHIERPQRFPDVPLEKLERDTAVERALARDLRAAHGWHFRRDGPAFVLQRDDRTVSVEVLGFYTPEYLRTRLASSGGDLILCVDESLSCADGELPREVLRFSRRIRVTSLLEAVEKVDRRREPG